MKNAKIIFTLIITSMLLMPFMNFAVAAQPSYVGIAKDDELIWYTTFDSGPYANFWEDYYEHLGFDPDSEFIQDIIDNITDDYFDNEYDEKIVAWRIKILSFKDEKEDHDYKYVEYRCNIYTSKVRGYIGNYGFDWKLEEDNEKGRVWKYDKDLYKDIVWLDQGLFYLIPANNIKWSQLVDEINDEWGDDWDGRDEKANCEVATSMYFFMQVANGLSTTFNPDEDDFQDFTSISQYNRDGVLIYYNWAYDGDTIMQFELQTRPIYLWWWAAAIIAVAAVIIIVVIVVVKKR
ncbi:MAG: hypothetical protein ACFFDK_09605 [Promethearchaeota archaeon]